MFVGFFGVKVDVVNYVVLKVDVSLCYVIGGGFVVGVMVMIKSFFVLVYMVVV